MFGTEDLVAVLTALAAIKASDMTDAERASAISVVREEFLIRADDRLSAIVERLTSPEVPVEQMALDLPKGKKRGA